MRRAALTVLIVFYVVAPLPAPAWAEEEKSALELVNDLEQIIRDENAKWADKNKAYKATKAAIDDGVVDSIVADRTSLADKTYLDEASRLKIEESLADTVAKHPAEAAYADIRPMVADAMRRNTLPASGWIMGFFGATLLWGGFSVCLAIARKSGRKIDPQAD